MVACWWFLTGWLGKGEKSLWGMNDVLILSQTQKGVVKPSDGGMKSSHVGFRLWESGPCDTFFILLNSFKILSEAISASARSLRQRPRSGDGSWIARGGCRLRLTSTV